MLFNFLDIPTVNSSELLSYVSQLDEQKRWITYSSHNNSKTVEVSGNNFVVAM
jgi:hypothetical protein